MARIEIDPDKWVIDGIDVPTGLGNISWKDIEKPMKKAISEPTLTIPLDTPTLDEDDYAVIRWALSRLTSDDCYRTPVTIHQVRDLRNKIARMGS